MHLAAPEREPEKSGRGRAACRPFFLAWPVILLSFHTSIFHPLAVGSARRRLSSEGYGKMIFGEVLTFLHRNNRMILRVTVALAALELCRQALA